MMKDDVRPSLLLSLAFLAVPPTALAEPRVVLDFGGVAVSAARLRSTLLAQLTAKAPPSSVSVRHAVVAGSLDLSEWDLPFILRFSACDFEGDAEFSRFHTDRSLLFDRCVFRGRANLAEIHVGRDLRADHCRFLGTKPTDAPRDNDPTTLIHTRVGDDLSLNFSTFEGTVNLRHLSVGRDLYLQDAVFHGGVKDPDGEKGTIFPIKLEGSQVGHFLRIDRVLDDNPRVRIAISDCRFEGVFAQMKRRPEDEEAGEESLMLKMLEDLSYRAESYNLIEREFVRRGRQDLADDVYIHGQNRETDAAKGFARLRGLTLRLVAGYGRKPALAFAWCFLVVLLGAFVFETEEGGARDRKRLLRAFWYSLDLFVPIVSVSGKEPEPPEGAFARSYVRIHRLLGWLLLPIALAAVSGVVGKG